MQFEEWLDLSFPPAQTCPSFTTFLHTIKSQISPFKHNPFFSHLIIQHPSTMANPLLLSLSLCFLFLFNACLASGRHNIYRKHFDEDKRQYRKCRLDRLDALEPSNRIEAEGGVIEIWDPNHEQFECAGVAVQRYIIDPKGLVLPQYTNAPRLVYIERVLIWDDYFYLLVSLNSYLILTNVYKIQFKLILKTKKM